MKANRYNVVWIFLLGTVIGFGQNQSKKVSESFKVNKDVLIEINTKHSDVTVETWNKNTVDVKGVWEIEGMTKEEADKYFSSWDFEALGNKNKVVITSKSSNNYYEHYDVFDDIDFDFDMESISHIGEMFQGNYFSDLPSMPPVPAIVPMPPVSPLPALPAPFIDHIKQIEFDYDAYIEDKESYMKEFEKKQQAWEKEFEEKLAPQMEAYQKKMEEWQKKMEPQMKVYEEKIKQWEKEYEPKLKEYELKMERKLKEMEKEMKAKYALKMKEKEAKMSKYKITKRLLIKIPKGATLKIDSRYGKISLPDHIKTIN